MTTRGKSAGFVLLVLLGLLATPTGAQPPSDEARAELTRGLEELQAQLADLKRQLPEESRIADAEIFAKAVEWNLRHDEFFDKRYEKDSLAALEHGKRRAEQLAERQTPWMGRTGSSILAYVSKVDGSVQPYALSLPEGIDPSDGKRWPLHVNLHGRSGGKRNEVRFIREHEGKALPEGQDFIQLDVFGRIDNAYRFSGETDVFEALQDVKRRFRIDDTRITLRGFSMGGAGAWHLGVHHPSLWSSVGPGAGFIDFYKYQKQTEKLPPHQDAVLHIYDALDYAMNAANVPVCTYGGELDAQLAAGQRMTEAAQELGIDIKLLIGPKTGHKFHPDSLREFMAFHREHSQRGRPSYPGRSHIRFITYTVKYNHCEWLTVEEMIRQYEPATVEGGVDPATGLLKIKTQNVAVLQIARDVADHIEIDGTRLPLLAAADGLLPGVYYARAGDRWSVLDYEASRAFTNNPDLQKRHDLQGPIDDAFMQPFVCVRGTGTPWSAELNDWAQWTLSRFDREFDKWLRGRIPQIDDTQLTDEMIANQNLVLFGDPGSNQVLAKIVDRLPIRWTKDGLEVNGQEYDTSTHGVSLIYPNPLNPRQYVVINSGHTFHERDFKASNAWLFPRLGDIAVQKFQRKDDGTYDESTAWAALFNSSWQLP